MRMHRVLVVMSVVVMVGGVIRAQTNPSFGTWKLNLAKSTFSPGPPPRSEMRTYEAWGQDGIKGTFTTVDASGRTSTTGFQANYDGKDYKFTGASDFDTLALKRIDANTTATTQKRAGKVVGTTQVVVSPDGRTRTLTQDRTNRKGQRVHNVLVFDRQ